MHAELYEGFIYLEEKNNEKIHYCFCGLMAFVTNLEANIQGRSFFGALLVSLGISAGVWGICGIVSDDCSFETNLPSIGF